MAGYRLDLDKRAIARLAVGDEVVDFLDGVGQAKADRAEQLAPKKTGRGARAVEHETGQDDDGVYTRIGYAAGGFYMSFVELGTEDTPPEPHLRPALDEPLDD